MGTDKKQEVHTHKIGIYLWIWGLLFVFSFFSYMVDYMNYQGLLRWSLIVFFMLAKAGFIMARKAWRGDFDTGRRGFFTSQKSDYEAVEIMGLYWHFVDLVWVFIFAFFYLW